MAWGPGVDLSLILKRIPRGWHFKAWHIGVLWEPYGNLMGTLWEPCLFP